MIFPSAKPKLACVCVSDATLSYSPEKRPHIIQPPSLAARGEGRERRSTIKILFKMPAVAVGHKTSEDGRTDRQTDRRLAGGKL